MIVDDSRFIRKIVHEILQADPGIYVAGYAGNGQEALSKIEELKPDLILLDWDMPVMKGSTTLMHIMIRSPCPVVVLSGFVGGVGANPFDLLCLGGVDFLRKPQNNWRTDGRADDLVYRIKEASKIKFERVRRIKMPKLIKESGSPYECGAPASRLLLFGSATGGCTDLIRIVPNLPRELPAAVIILHDMQQQAIGAFIDYLDRRSLIHVRALEQETILCNDTVYVHPSSAPIELTGKPGDLRIALAPDLPKQRSLDHFLVSASKIMRKDLIAVLLSGGSDSGIIGLRSVKHVDGISAVQDPSQSLDPRMAEGALAEGIVDYKWSAETIADTVQNLLK